MRAHLVLSVVVAAFALLVAVPVARADEPADGAAVRADHEVDFEVDALGYDYTLRVARDASMTQLVFERPDPDDIGMWTIVPADEGMTPGGYFWQACWTDESYPSPTLGQRICTAARTLAVVPPKPGWGRPRDGARYPANAEIEFRGAGGGDRYRLVIARDAGLTDVVLSRGDAWDIGQWFVVPRNRGMGRGTYFWQACWRDPDLRHVCTTVRRLVLTKPRVPTLTASAAHSAVEAAIYDHGGPQWAALSGSRYACRRRSRIRMTCRPAGWAGDVLTRARLRLVNRMDGRTRVSGTMTFFDEYCADVTHGRHCRSRRRVSGVY